MKFTISREALLKPLTLVAGVVERRQTLPILANIMLVLDGKQLSITGTDLEVELVGRLTLEGDPEASGEITIPAKKLLDICKSLPDSSNIEIATDDQNRVVVKAGRSRFTLSSLPAKDFPNVEEGPGSQHFVIRQGDLKRLIDRTAFAMAQQDVRYYLNGMLLEVSAGQLRVVSTDGHRLAMCTLNGNIQCGGTLQVILPRKGVIELARLMTNDDGEVEVVIGANHVRASTREFIFTSKLVDGKFPDYARVLPNSSSKIVLGRREELRQAFGRASILSNEKYRGVRMNLSDGNLQIVANNPEQEEAEETVAVEYSGKELEIGFNVSYLMDVLAVLDSEKVKLSLSDASSSVLIEDADGSDSVYVVMPMRL